MACCWGSFRPELGDAEPCKAAGRASAPAAACDGAAKVRSSASLIMLYAFASCARVGRLLGTGCLAGLCMQCLCLRYSVALLGAVCYFVSRWSQAAVQQCEDGEAPADEGKDTSASGAGVPGSHGVHIDATAGSNAHLTAELAAAAPYELPGEAARPFFDPGFSPVAESFDVNPEANDGLRKLPLDRYTAQSGLGRPYPTAAAGPAAAALPRRTRGHAARPERAGPAAAGKPRCVPRARECTGRLLIRLAVPARAWCRVVFERMARSPPCTQNPGTFTGLHASERRGQGVAARPDCERGAQSPSCSWHARCLTSAWPWSCWWTASACSSATASATPKW